MARPPERGLGGCRVPMPARSLRGVRQWSREERNFLLRYSFFCEELLDRRCNRRDCVHGPIEGGQLYLRTCEKSRLDERVNDFGRCLHGVFVRRVAYRHIAPDDRIKRIVLVVGEFVQRLRPLVDRHTLERVPREMACEHPRIKICPWAAIGEGDFGPIRAQKADPFESRIIRFAMRL